MKIVLDTNILLPAISRKSLLHWVFRNLIDDEYTLCVTTEILLEYAEMLEKFLSPLAASHVMETLEHLPNIELITVYYKWGIIPNDADDNKFSDCVVATNADYLFTHDKHFNPLKKISFPKIEVISAEVF